MSSQVIKIPLKRRKQLVREVFSGKFTAKQLAAKWGCSSSHINAIKRGKTYADLCPRLQRTTTESVHRRCTSCLHYSGEDNAPCGLGFPDANSKAWRTDRLHEYKDGRVKAAVLCSAYIDATNKEVTT